MKLATFAAGCFWGVEERFIRSGLVLSTKVGYTGGHVPHPTYHQVCTGTTGHVEAVQVTFDPTKTSYNSLLDLFWGLHDPTQVDGQGPDLGLQYRSIIFFHDEEQKSQAEQSRSHQATLHSRPIVTKIEPANVFYPAEEYHQRYICKAGWH